MAYHPVKASHFPGFSSRPQLIARILSCDLEGLKELFAAGVDVSVKYAGRPAIYWATTVESTEPLRLLLEHGADANACADNDDPPIMRTASTGDLEKLRMLLDAGANPNTMISGHPILFSLSTGEHHEAATLLIERGADINLPNLAGDLPIHGAAPNRRSEMLRVMLSAGADVNAADHSGTLPIVAAIHHGAPESVQMLLDAGARLPEDVRDESYWESIFVGDDPGREKNIAAIRRVVRAALAEELRKDIERAMPDDATPPTGGARRSTGPGPL